MTVLGSSQIDLMQRRGRGEGVRSYHIGTDSLLTREAVNTMFTLFNTGTALTLASSVAIFAFRISSDASIQISNFKRR